MQIHLQAQLKEYRASFTLRLLLQSIDDAPSMTTNLITCTARTSRRLLMRCCF